MLDLKILSENIKILRKKKGFSQQKLADKCDLTYQFIQNIEYSEKLPSLETLVKLANALDISPAIFFMKLNCLEELQKVINDYTKSSDI